MHTQDAFAVEHSTGHMASWSHLHNAVLFLVVLGQSL